MSYQFKQGLLISATAIIGLLFAGCSESRVAQCNKMVKVANEAVALSQEFSESAQVSDPKEGAKAFVEVATKIDMITATMKGLEISDEKLQGFQAEFVKLYEGVSKGLRDGATALEKNDLEAAQTAFTTIENSSKGEDQLVNNVNSYCSGQS
jgi:hypothetical protein